MSRRWAEIAVMLVVVATWGGIAVWGVRAMHYVPSAEEIQARPDFHPFLVEPSNVEGVYGNMDVDSAVFRYTTAADEDEFWQRIEGQTRGTDWVVIPSDGDVRRYQRVLPPSGQQVCWWVDELRIRYRPSGRVIVVGWVQADPYNAVAGLSECSESEFAERAIWPLVRGE